MTELYSKPVIKFEKVAAIQLSNDIVQWHGEILEHVINNNEYLAQYLAPGVEWENDSLDEERGAAFGKLFISRGDQTGWIPIIVKDFDMQPVDMFFVGDDGYVLSEENIDLNLPISNDIGVASMPVKTLERRANLFSKLSSVNPERIDRYMTALQGKDIAFATRKAGTTDKLARVIEGYRVAPKKENVNVGTTRVFDFMPGMKLATDYRYGSKINISNEKDKTASEKLAEGISSEWERVSGIIPAPSFFAKEAAWSPIAEAGTYKVKTADGESAYVLSSPVSSLKADGSFLAGDQQCNVAFGGDLDGKLLYVTGEIIHGEKSKQEYKFSEHVIAFADMVDGQAGILMAPAEDGVVNLGRVKMIERKTLPSQRSSVILKVMMNGQAAYCFIISNKLSSAVPIDKADALFHNGMKNFEIPNDWEVAILDDEVELADSEGPAKLAGATVRLTPDGSLYWKFEKMGSDGSTRSDTETDHHMAARLASMGFAGDLAEVVKIANDEGSVTISGLRDRPILDKIASRRPVYTEALLARVTKNSSNSQVENLKLASAVMSDIGEASGDTVDSILSLGLVDDENIQFFVDSIPDFEGVLKALVKLLLKARLGMDNIDSITVKKAVTYLDATIRDLKALRKSVVRK